jgi:prepilin-type N-terminal cleavage/methylation domain-containing protein
MQLPSRIRPSGFTLIELLVVIAILAMLLGLLLPALQRARFAAGRIDGSNQLRQLALATQQYQDQNGSLPDFATPINNTPTNLPVSSVFTRLLPYVEQQALYQDVLAEGLTGASVTVKLYVSPLDGSSSTTAGGTSYVANDQVFGTPGQTLAHSFPDGTSQTLLFSERLMRCGQGPSAVFNAWPIVVALTVVGSQASTVPARLVQQGPPQFGPTVADCIPGGASSPDTAGILAALADGSMRLVSRAAAQGTTAGPGRIVLNWQAFLTPAGGEVLGPDW